MTTPEPLFNLSTAWQQLLEKIENNENYPSHLKALVKAMLDATVIPCDQIQESLPYYVEYIVGGYTEPNPYSNILQHLNWCKECKAVYIDLLDAANVWDETIQTTYTANISIEDYAQLVTKELILMLYPHRLQEFELLMQMMKNDKKQNVAEPKTQYENKIPIYDIFRAIYETTVTLPLEKAHNNDIFIKNLRRHTKSIISTYSFPQQQYEQIVETYIAITIGSLPILHHIQKS